MPHELSDIFHVLEERGFIHQCTDPDGLRKTLVEGARSAYIGFDATADSLHVGHLQGLMLMCWLQRARHRPILLCSSAVPRPASATPGISGQMRAVRLQAKELPPCHSPT